MEKTQPGNAIIFGKHISTYSVYRLQIYNMILDYIMSGLDIIIGA